MRWSSTLLIFLFVSFSGLAKKITGTVTDAVSGERIAFANVFFAGTLNGTTTDLKGNFELSIEESGRYELIISYVGYNQFSKLIEYETSYPKLDIKLEPEVVELEDIYVNADTTGWKNNYLSFKGLFLGETENAEKVDIKNPKDIFLYFDRVDNGLFAHSRKEIIIENNALGYRLNYIMKDFQMYYRTGQFTSFGIPRFEVMEPRGKGQLKKWNKERKKAYLGSFNHFLKSIVANTFSEQGYIVQELWKVPNTDRPPQELIDRKLKAFRDLLKVGGTTINLNSDNSDSLRYWSRMQRLPVTIDSIGREFTSNEDLINVEQELVYQGYLRIIYTKEPEDPAFARNRIGGGVDIKQTSTIYVYEPFKIYDNGYFDPSKVLFTGYLGWASSIAEMLPSEYRPEEN